MGYRFGFIRNSLLVISAAAVIAFVWLIVAVGEKLRNFCVKEESRHTRFEVTLNNFVVRFLLEVYFELMICAFITISSPSSAGSTWWLISLACILVSLATMVGLVNLFFKNGPYIEDSYEKGGILESFWGRRHLSRTMVSAVLDDKTALTSRTESLALNYPIDKGTCESSNTQSIYNSNKPLNQQICAAIDLDV